jgi:hypothetical protein
MVFESIGGISPPILAVFQCFYLLSGIFPSIYQICVLFDLRNDSC